MKRIVDLLFLVIGAIAVSVVMVGAFIFAEVYHHNPLWTFVIIVSVALLVIIRQKYKVEFRSARFIFFVLGCLVINVAVIVMVLSFLGWLYLFPAFFVEQVLFYMLIDRLFGIRPSRGRQS